MRGSRLGAVAGVLILWALAASAPLMAQQPAARPARIEVSVMVLQPVAPDTIRVRVRADSLRLALRASPADSTATPRTLVLAYVGN
jgi:hypothetical protein